MIVDISHITSFHYSDLRIVGCGYDEMRYFHGPLLGEGAYGEVYAMFHRSLGGSPSNVWDRGRSSDETFLEFFSSPPFKELEVGEYDNHESEDACLKQE